MARWSRGLTPAARRSLKWTAQQGLRDAAGERVAGEAVPLLRSRSGFRPAQLPQLLQDFVKALAANELHGVIVNAVLLADAEDRDDICVVETCRGPRLAAEALEVGRVQQSMERQDL